MENSNNNMKLLIAQCCRNFAEFNLCSLPTFPAKLLICSQQGLKYLLNQSKTYLKREILFEFDLRFYTNKRA